MDELKEKIEQLRLAYGRLTQQEQLGVVAAVAGVFLLFMVLISYGVTSAINKAEHRVKVKTEQLQDVLSLQQEYRLRETERKAMITELRRSNVNLVSLVERVAQQAGVEIGQLQPTEGEPNAEGVLESRVDLRAEGLSADRLQDFLKRIEEAPGIIIVRRLEIERPYRKENVNLKMTVSTLKHTAS